MGSFITRTSVTLPNCPKYSLSLSWLVCQERPPTKSFPGAESELGVERPLDSPWDPGPPTSPLEVRGSPANWSMDNLKQHSERQITSGHPWGVRNPLFHINFIITLKSCRDPRENSHTRQTISPRTSQTLYVSVQTDGRLLVVQNYDPQFPSKVANIHNVTNNNSKYCIIYC